MNNLFFNNDFMNNDYNSSDSDENEQLIEPIIHLRLQQRTVKKFITIVEGMSEDDAEEMVKYLRKNLNTNGTTRYDKDDEIIAQFQGDKRKAVRDYLIKNTITSKDNIKIHGF